jgi:hypothetical protein
VVRTPGSADCTDTIQRTAEVFGLSPARPGLRPRLLFGAVTGPVPGEAGDASLAGGGTGAFPSHCAGPLGDDLVDALPRKLLSAADLRRPAFDALLTGSRGFRAGGFVGSVTADVRIRLARIHCTPRDRRPACEALNGL